MYALTREWTRPSGVLADAVRVLLLASALATLPFQPAEVPLRFGLMLAVLLGSRWLDVPRPFDAAFGLLMLTSGWASAAGWYFEHRWIDIPIHFALTGTAATVAYVALVRAGQLPAPRRHDGAGSTGTVALLVVLLGGTMSALWEMYEWLAEAYLPSRILVGYDDSIGDMANGVAGSVVAGLLMAAWLHTGHDLRGRE
jgi:hypothetical protein